MEIYNCAIYKHRCTVAAGHLAHFDSLSCRDQYFDEVSHRQRRSAADSVHECPSRFVCGEIIYFRRVYASYEFPGVIISLTRLDNPTDGNLNRSLTSISRGSRSIGGISSNRFNT